MENPQEIDDIAEEMKKKLVPDESKKEYEKVYNEFKIWKQLKKITTTTENVIFSYINNLEQTYTITTIKKKISIIKTMIRIYEKIETKNYFELQAYVNKEMKNHTPKKSYALTDDDYNNFLQNADDDQFLDIKVSKNFIKDNNKKKLIKILKIKNVSR